jgi:hypothetical protein
VQQDGRGPVFALTAIVIACFVPLPCLTRRAPTTCVSIPSPWVHPVVSLISPCSTPCALAAVPIMAFIAIRPACPTLAAIPIVPFVTSLATGGTFAAFPFVLPMSRLTALGTFLTVLRPIVLFVARLAACLALTPVPIVPLLAHRSTLGALLAILFPVMPPVLRLATHNALAAVPSVVTKDALQIHATPLLLAHRTGACWRPRTSCRSKGVPSIPSASQVGKKRGKKRGHVLIVNYSQFSHVGVPRLASKSDRCTSGVREPDGAW